ncbi:MAG: T9SS type A sorting domain-containing protein [Saprospiraceae bacterium]
MQHLIRINSILLLMILSLSLKSQTTSWTLKCILESKLQHSSGILTLNEGQTFWTQVDNSSPAELYEIDLNCKILRTVKIIGVSKTDWEEITTDYQGNIYLGDFGNNNNSRQDLKIYILRAIASNLSDSILPELIQFNYNNQTAFPPAAANRNFDMEAMVWYQDTLHLFSKNRTDPFTGYTYQYKIPAIPGTYAVHPADSFKTGDGPDVFFWITGAAFNPIDTELILLSHDRLWKFSGFEGSRFFSGKNSLITLPTYSQKEGICYAKENTWYLTDEYFSSLRIGGNLYEMKLEPTKIEESDSEIEFAVFPNPAQRFLEILIPKINPDHPDQLILYDALGSILLQTRLDKMRTLIPIEHLVNGIYFIRAYSKKMNRFIVKRVLKVE